MNEATTNKRKCRNCNACRLLYAKFYYWTYDVDKFYCTVREEITDPENVCGCWEQQKKEYDLSLARLDKVEEDIRFLMKYAEEEEPRRSR